LAALALAGVAEQRERGYDLRSRSFLVPESASPLVLELVPAQGGEPERRLLNTEVGRALLQQAEAQAREVGFGWKNKPLELVPAPKLADLIRKSRELAAKGQGDEEVS
jgi:CRISPR-associated protein Csb1